MTTTTATTRTDLAVVIPAATDTNIERARITMERKQLAAILARIADTAPKRSPKPVLQNVRIDINGKVWFSATDVERYHRESLDDATSRGEASVLVNAVRLRKAVTSSKAKQLTLVFYDDSVSIAGQSITTGPSPDEMPEAPFSSDAYPGATIALSAEYLATMIDRTLFATDCESSRFALGGLLIETDGANYLRLVGTDGHRLSTDYHGQPRGAADVKTAIVPNAAINGVLKALRKADDVCVILSECGKWVTFVVYRDGFRFAEYTCRQLEGRFPNWRDVIPTVDYPAVCEIEAERMMEELTAAVASTSEESRAVDMCCADSLLSFSTQSPENGKYFGTMAVLPANGVQTLDMSLDCRYVLDASKAAKQNVLTLSAFDVHQETKSKKQSDGPVVFCCGHWTYVLMPLARDRVKKQA